MRNHLTTLLVAMLACLTFMLPTASGAEKKERAKILLVGTDPDHGHGEHEYMQGLKVVADCLRHVPEAEVHVINGWPTDEQFRDADAMVLFCAWGGDFVLKDSKHRQKFLSLIKGGMGYGTIHFACDITPDLEKQGLGEVYMEALGAYYETGYSRNPHNDAELRPANLQHPTNRGLEPFKVRDELYFRLRYMPRTEPIMVARIRDADGDIDRRVAWCYERPDGGRSFGFTGAHFHRNFKVEGFRRLIVNGTLWIAGLEIPEGGANVECDEKLFIAPPR